MGGLAIVPTRSATDQHLRTRELRVLIALSSYADRDGYAWPAVATLADDLGCARETVSRALSVLADRGYLVIQTSRMRGAIRARSYNSYRLIREVQHDLFDRDKGCHNAPVFDSDNGDHTEPAHNVTRAVTGNVTDSVTQKEPIEGIPPHTPPGGQKEPAVNRPGGRAGVSCEEEADAPGGATSRDVCAPGGARALSGGSSNEKFSPEHDHASLLEIAGGFRMRRAYASTWLTGVLRELEPGEIAEIMQQSAVENLTAERMRAAVSEKIAVKRRGGEIAAASSKPASPPAADIAAWLAALDQLKAEMPASAFTWIRGLELAAPINGEAILRAPSRSFADMATAEDNLDRITAALAAQRPGLSTVRVRVGVK